MHKAPLSPQQRRIMTFLEGYIEAHQYPPLHSEIARRFRMDESAVHRQLRAMQDKGYIQFQRYKQRSIKLKVEKI